MRGADDTAEAILKEKPNQTPHDLLSLIKCCICRNDVCMLETLRRIAIKQGSVETMILKLANTSYDVGKNWKHCYQTDGLQYQYSALNEELKSLTIEQGISIYFAAIHEN